MELSKISYKIRILIVASAVYIVFAYLNSFTIRSGTRPPHHDFSPETFIFFLVPLILLWGGAWVYSGWRNQRSN